ncbi:hypothetical protein D3C85_1650410 [compost metagenome]
MEFIGADQLGTIVACHFEVLGACAALRTQTDLKDTADVSHFRGAADRAGKAFANAVDFVAPV